MIRSSARPAPPSEPKTDSKPNSIRPSPLRSWMDPSGRALEATCRHRFSAIEESSTPRTSLCRRVPKTHRAWGSTRAACQISYGPGVSRDSTAALQAAGPGASPGWSTRISKDAVRSKQWRRVPWEHQKAGATPATATSISNRDQIASREVPTRGSYPWRPGALPGLATNLLNP
jgi:hypothetical protein